MIYVVVVIGQNNLLNDANHFLHKKTTSSKSKILIDTNDEYRKVFKKRDRSKVSIEDVDPTQQKKWKQKYSNESIHSVMCRLQRDPTRKYIVGELNCEICTSGRSENNQIAVSLYSTNYILGVGKSTEWFSTDFIVSFIDLMSHKYHRTDIKVFVCIMPHEKITKEQIRELSPDVTNILVLAHDQLNHYALLIIDLLEHVVWVTDGLNKKPSTWFFHLTNIFKKCKLLPLSGCINDVVKTDQWYDSKVDNKDDNHKFIMMHDINIIQQDLFSCGPTACVKLSIIWQLAW